nr:MAG: putative RNA-dependent RNA polymerase [Jiangsu sediment cysto-like virus 1]QYF49684.1 MAG: putative RNA-dependent RNA polymerase [Jiangsu sediment cysto-like virus3]
MVTPAFPYDDKHVRKLFVGKRAERNRLSQFREGPIDILPGIFSNDPRFLAFKDLLSRNLTTRCPENVDPFGRVYGNGVRSNFYGLRHVNGYPMLPATYPLADNTKTREDEGLANSFVEPWHELLLKAIIRVVFRQTALEPQPLRVREGTSSVCPFFTNKMPQKLEQALFSLTNMEKAGTLIAEGKYEQAFLEYFIGGAYFTVYRSQSSDVVNLVNGVFVSKDRPAADLEYALTGGLKGQRIPADKTLGDVGFKKPDGFFRERRRTAFGGPWGLNSILALLAQPVRKSLYGRFSKTYHLTTRTATQELLRSWQFAIAADVSNHDQLWPMFVHDFMNDELLEMGYPEWWVSMNRMKGHLPYYVTSVGPGKDPVLIGDWCDPSNKGGLLSGNSFTDLDGTIQMTWNYLIVQLQHTMPQLIKTIRDLPSAINLVERYLSWDLPFVLMDKSDDALMGWTDPVLVPAAEKLMHKMQKGERVSPYMHIGYEHGAAMLGHVLLYPKSMDFGELHLIGNIVSLVVNSFSPEYGVDWKTKDRSKVKRPFPGLAWKTTPQVYGTCPAYADVMDEVERCWYKIYGESYSFMRDELLREDEKRLADYLKTTETTASIGDLTPIDIEVLASPEKLQYKFLEEDLTPGVVTHLFKGLPLEQTEPFFNSIVKG